MPVAWLLGTIQGRTHNTFGQKWVISAGLSIATIGFGEYHFYLYRHPLTEIVLSSALLWLLDENTRVIIQSLLPLFGGLGIGMLFHAPYQALMSVLSPKELAAGTGAFFLVRFTGATVGLACGFLTTMHLLSVDILFVLSPSRVQFTKAVYLVTFCMTRPWHLSRPRRV